MKLQTVDQFCADNPAFKIGGVRWQIRKEDENGLKEAGAVLRIGRKVLINPEKWFKWIKNRN